MNNISKKKLKILIDLDGVLNTYSGEYISDYIPPIKGGAYEFIKELSKIYIVKIFTARDKFLVNKWILKNNLSDFISGITNEKEPAWLYIDDRCIKFEGNYQILLSKIENFKVWYSK